MIRHQKSVWNEILDGISYIRAKKEIGVYFLDDVHSSCSAAGAIYVVIIVFLSNNLFTAVTK